MDTNIDAWVAKEEHFNCFVELNRTHYADGHHALDAGFFRWFYLDNPAGPATFVVAHEAGQWIGVIVLIPILLQRDGALQRACFAVNVLTHPEHRGKNLFSKMIRHAKDVLAEQQVWLLGHPNASALGGWKRHKMDFRTPLSLFLAKYSLLSSFNSSKITSSVELAGVPDGFFSTLSERDGLHVKVTREFIKWRYLDAPHRTYAVRLIVKGGEVQAIHVTRRFKGPFDLMVDYFGDLPAANRGSLSTLRPTLVMHAGEGHVGNILRRLAWKLPVKRQFPFFVSTWGQEAADDMSHISLSASDF
jgi:GNAT superfamily N-acetyltransferase